MVVTIDRAGRVVIPKEIRDRLGLAAETELSIDVEGESIRLERRPGSRRRLVWTDDGRPYFAADDERPLTDLDVQRLRDSDQR